MELTGGARLVVTEGEDVVAGLRKREEETYFGQYANATQAEKGRARARPAGEKGKGRWLAGLRGRVGRLAAGPIGLKSKEKILFRINIGFLNLPRLCKFVEGDLGGILT
jgi:hypothetical protein